MAELIFEIGTEELPAGFIRPALEGLSTLLLKELNDLALSHGEPITFGTPRRLGIVLNVEAQQPDRTEKVMGPKVDLCFDAEKKPTKTGLGFAKGQGVAVESLEVVEGPKGLCVQATRHLKGQPAAMLLPEVLFKVIAKIPFRKSMRWASLDEAFARPIHWIVAVLDGEILPLSFAGVKSGNESQGHRFLCPELFKVKNSEQFFEHLSQSFVIPFHEERKSLIREESRRLAEQAGGKLMEDEPLFDEVADLVEYPFPELGSFENEYLIVPKEILVSSMAKHQRYFAITDGAGNLLRRFVGVLGTKVDDPKVAVAGNEKVLRARLSDARFFFEEDRKKHLSDFAPGLEKVTFEERLGTIAEKVRRIQEQLRFLAPYFLQAKLDEALRASELCKADLLTNVVFEFPELQGIMGRIYANLDGEAKGVADAIEQHYWPRFADDGLPENDVSAMLAIADKMDTLAGCFGVGLIPTGAADPYALRRQALGILRILNDGAYDVPLKEWVEHTVNTLRPKLKRTPEETLNDVLRFVEGRYRNWKSGAFTPDLIDAVVTAGFETIPDVEKRLTSLSEFQKREEYLSLAVAFKRVMNILKERVDASVKPDLFEHESEKELWEQFGRLRESVFTSEKSGAYLHALMDLSKLRKPVDSFFESVLVMSENPEVQKNRLALLTALSELFRKIADFRKIQTD